MATETEQNAETINRNIWANLETHGREKVALDMINNYTRLRMREDGFLRKIMPGIPIQNDKLDRALNHEKPIKIIDREPNSPAAISIPFGTLPDTVLIRGSKYIVAFERIVSPRFTKDSGELRTYEMDIRQIVSDNAVKDMLAEEDGKFIRGVNTALIGQDMVTAWSQTTQWESLSGGVSRNNWYDSLMIMPRTDAHLMVKKALMNNVTIMQFQKWDRNEAGGDLSEEMLRDGFTMRKLGEVEIYSTIKRSLVPDNSVYFFADDNFIGKHFTLEDTVMYVKREAFMMEFFAYQTSGIGIGHTGGLARADYLN